MIVSTPAQPHPAARNAVGSIWNGWTRSLRNGSGGRCRHDHHAARLSGARRFVCSARRSRSPSSWRARSIRRRLTLQTKGDGPLHLMVADVTTSGAVRGYAQFDAAKLERRGSPSTAAADRLGAAPARRRLRRLHVDQASTPTATRASSSCRGDACDCAHHYSASRSSFRPLKLAVGRMPAPPGGRWHHAAAPGEGGRTADAASIEAQEDGWRRAMVLMSSTTSGELLAPELAPQDLCRSSTRTASASSRHTRSRPAAAARASASSASCGRCRSPTCRRWLSDKEVSVTCEFCSTTYVFRKARSPR